MSHHTRSHQHSYKPPRRRRRQGACCLVCEVCGCLLVGRCSTHPLYACLCRSCQDGLAAVTTQPVPGEASQEKGGRMPWT
jgi:hypothetical protein